MVVSGKPCLVPKRIPHATIIPKTEVAVFGDQVKVTCNRGYGVNGSSHSETQHIQCKPNQIFEETMPCQGAFIHILINTELHPQFI